ncbi:PhnE/PtxC family ABC transporter permease [Rubritalea tangerina]|uniref:PhnE/PtxC family ABC transporter permease n=1 Tax=Rubritalea tangerina TaxID=430798 RepID=A0ABW4ZEF8_9BACT
MAKPPLANAPLLSWRRFSLLSALVLFVYCVHRLGLDFVQLPPSADPLEAAKIFFSAALEPALTDQNPSLPEGSDPFIQRIFEGILTTLRYAFIAMSMAVPLGLVLGFFSSKAWWPLKRQSSASHSTPLYRGFLSLVRLCVRFLITFMRSIHELIWVLLFLAFLGDSPFTACVALALPFTGTLAKVFSEIIDEASDANSKHILLAGGSNLQAFFCARLPQALPDIVTYTMYRLECAIRSSAVLGFIGIETIGLSIHQSYENTYYNEVWTELYLLIGTIVIFDILGSHVRKRIHHAPLSKLSPANYTLNELRRTRPRWLSLPIVFGALLIGVITAWSCGEPLDQYHSHLSRLERTQKFLKQLVPEPVRDSGQWSDASPWLHELWQNSGSSALSNTLIMATAALLLAAIMGYSLVPWASRNIANIASFGIPPVRKNKVMTFAWSLLGIVMRSIFLVSRSLPEYILAFLLIGILGAHAWPLIFALAIHNFGILGRLWSEVSENHDEKPAQQMVVRGASRLQAYLFGILPTGFNRQLLFIFYRWETCVRESTILGMLSLSSLGYYISQEAAFLRYDSMLFFILLGTIVIFLSDVISVILRAKLKSS